jgi:hypothetical protein
MSHHNIATYRNENLQYDITGVLCLHKKWMLFSSFSFGVGASSSPFLVGLMTTWFPKTSTYLRLTFWSLSAIAAIICVPLLLLKVSSNFAQY